MSSIRSDFLSNGPPGMHIMNNGSIYLAIYKCTIIQVQIILQIWNR